MSILVIHEAETRKSEEDKAAEKMIDKAVKLFKEDIQTWPKLSTADMSIAENQLMCIAIAEDYKKVINVCSSTEVFFTFKRVCNAQGKPEKGINALSWNVLENARYKLVTLAQSDDISEVKNE